MKQGLFLLAASALSIGAATAGEITGVVTENSGAYPLEGAIVKVAENGRTATTDRDGSFRLIGLDAGSYTVEISYLGADAVSQTVSLASDADIADLSVVIGEGASVTDNLLVVGQRGALNAGLNQERASANLVEVISSDAIGQLPDENAAEALRRAVGTNVLNDQGEGRFVSIRGLSPELSSTTVNGVRLTSPEGDSRAVPLDVIDADVLERVVITKAITPDMDGDSFGGNVEIKTLSGLDQKDMLLNVKVGGVYTDQTEEFGERLSASYADNFMEGRLGVAGAISWQSREFGSENKEADGGEWELEEALAFPKEFELRDYLVTRERLSVSGNVDYKVTDNQRVYLTAFFNDFRDQEYRSRVEVKFEDGDFDGADGSVALLDGIEVDRDIKDREETQQLITVIAGHEWEAPFGQLDWSLSYVKAEEEEPNRYDSDFKYDGNIPGIIGVDVANPALPRLAFPDAAARAEFFNASSYEFDSIEVTDGITEDEEFAAAINAQFDNVFGDIPGFLKIGAKVSTRTSERDVDLDILETDEDLTLADFAHTVEYALDELGPVPSAGLMRSYFDGNRSLFELEELDSEFASLEGDFEAQEDIYAAYIMGKGEFGNVTLIGGVRVEHTEFEGDGLLTTLAEEDSTFDGVVLTDDQVFSSPITAEDSYTDFLPSIVARYDHEENLVFRASYFRSAVRPSLAAKTPSAFVEQDDENETEAALGNPTLDRQTADNFDVSFEWYPSQSAVFSAGVFYKTVEDFIAEVGFEGDELPADIQAFYGTTYDEASVFMNLDDADIFGVEFNYQQAFDFLPAPFDGIIAGANATFVDSSASFGDRDVSLPGQSDIVLNGVLGYEKGRFDLRAAATYRDEYLDELNGVESGVDRVVTDHLQIDIDAKVKITDQFRVFAGFKNVNDEAFEAVSTYSQGDFLNQYEEYGWSARFGVQYKY